MAASFSSLTLLSPQQSAAQRPSASASVSASINHPSSNHPPSNGNVRERERDRYEDRNAEGDASPLATLATAALAHPNPAANANQNQNQRHNYDHAHPHAHSPSLATLASAALAATPASVPGDTAGAGRHAKRKSVGGDADAMDVDSGPSSTANANGASKQRLLRPPPQSSAQQSSSGPGSSPAHRRTRSDGSLHTGGAGGSDLGVEGDEDELELDGEDGGEDGADGAEAEEGEGGGGGGKDGKDGKRHTCPHCNKRFNRPSSLKIHLNTHTGAKRTSPSIFFVYNSFLFTALNLSCVRTPTDNEYLYQ